MIKLYFKNITTGEVKLICTFHQQEEFDKYLNFFKIEAGKNGCVVDYGYGYGYLPKPTPTKFGH